MIGLLHLFSAHKPEFLLALLFLLAGITIRIRVGVFTFTEKVIFVLVIASPLLAAYNWGLGLMLLSATSLFAYASAEEVPFDPPTVAVMAIWGTRQEKVITQRWVFIYRGFPIVESRVDVNITQVSDSRTLESVRCRAEQEPPPPKSAKEPSTTVDEKEPQPSDEARSGGSVSVTVGIVYEPDWRNPKELLTYLNAGGQEGVLKILWQKIPPSLRQEAARHTWEGVAFSKARFSAMLIAIITGQQPRFKVRRDDQGRPIRAPDRPEQYEKEPVAPNEPLTELDYELFLQEISVNGAPDVQSLGCIIRQLNVEEVKPEGKLGEDAERLAREKQQLDAETRDFRTELALADAYLEWAKKKEPPQEISLEKALEYVRTNRGRATENIIRGGANVVPLFPVPPGTPRPEDGGTTA